MFHAKMIDKISRECLKFLIVAINNNNDDNKRVRKFHKL